MAWFGQQTQWDEDHGYDDPVVSTPSLRAWFDDMRQVFPPMNGPFATDDVDDPKITDYSVGRSVIYAAFAWSEAESALETVMALARQHRVGFFDVSSDDGDVWAPTAYGTYECLHGKGSL